MPTHVNGLSQWPQRCYQYRCCSRLTFFPNLLQIMLFIFRNFLNYLIRSL